MILSKGVIKAAKANQLSLDELVYMYTLFIEDD